MSTVRAVVAVVEGQDASILEIARDVQKVARPLRSGAA
ncbi:hypothetical protein FHS74_000507 [Nitrospirillum iridis]|uniref:Uncharacterized protein n=1 Tax=Nitrospirillum iridis TaxID=765888 RepID=A0A7X0ED50_9PROT|nr:hypothetical protein [Nitrospirillum iridis]